jgi:capsular polysaccharide transport system permease protein
LSLNVRAFSAEAAQAIAAASLDEASDMINRLSNEARTDIVASSGTDLDTAMERLRNARLAMAEFRIRNNVVDPVADLQADLSVIASLQQELAQHQIALDILRSDAQPARRGDEQRLAEAETGIAAIKARIADERAKFGGGQERDYVALLSEFEDLTLNTEFAQQAYLGALAAHEAARADAQRQTRYLSAHIAPTWAESAVHPRRWLLLGMVAGFGFLLWATVSLGAAGLADRR